MKQFVKVNAWLVITFALLRAAADLETPALPWYGWLVVSALKCAALWIYAAHVHDYFWEPATRQRKVADRA